MPAAAVIPAPIAYIKVVAVKKLVVGSWAGAERVCRDGTYLFARPFLLGTRLRASLRAGLTAPSGGVAAGGVRPGRRGCGGQPLCSGASVRRRQLGVPVRLL